jgi:hypothetical protein
LETIVCFSFICLIAVLTCAESVGSTDIRARVVGFANKRQTCELVTKEIPGSDCADEYKQHCFVHGWLGLGGWRGGGMRVNVAFHGNANKQTGKRKPD